MRRGFVGHGGGVDSVRQTGSFHDHERRVGRVGRRDGALCVCIAVGRHDDRGGVAGVLVVLGVVGLDRIHVDDPVGAVAVHGMNGVWGTLAVGLFGQTALGLGRDGLFHGGGLTQLGVQALGALAASGFAMAVMAAVFLAIHRIMGLRVSREEELRGLDIGEHGMDGYAGFQVFTTQ